MATFLEADRNRIKQLLSEMEHPVRPVHFTQTLHQCAQAILCLMRNH